MSLKLWDINGDSGPVSTFRVHEYLRPKQSIPRVWLCPGKYRATSLEASKNPMRRQVPTPSRPCRSLGNSLTRVVRRGAEITGVDANGNSFDFTTKLLHLAWHPSENSIACVAANSLYMYHARRKMVGRLIYICLVNLFFEVTMKKHY
ncbi:unnamed protein product [Trifolium pratense]|uniref:Uncharacterized protein n=1 Tax=Trifolium pratense TaxID=57577 RepID=A0ACB0L239_TRIPR|nr:unnamed protein product [Trifolium pratense]